MSSALLRQALEFVDPEETHTSSSSRIKRTKQVKGQDKVTSTTSKGKKRKLTWNLTDDKEQAAEENIKKLLKLSTPVADSTITEKIVERAVKGKALSDYIEVKKVKEQSILFPEESFGKFEREYFCS